MSQDYTVAKELASLKEIKQSAEQRISDLSLNALNYVNDHRLHKAGGGGDIDDYYDVIVEWEENDEESYPVITKFPTSDPGHQLRFAVKVTETDLDETYYYPLYSKGVDEDHNRLFSTVVLMNLNEAHCDVYKFIGNPSDGLSVEFVRTEIYSDPWPYFDVVVELYNRTGAGAGVYLKGSYEAIKSAYDSEDETFSMLAVWPKDEEQGRPANANAFPFFNFTPQDDLSYAYLADQYTYYFNPDNTISAARGEAS